MIKKMKVTECNVIIEKNDTTENTIIVIPFYPDRSSNKQVITRCEGLTGYKVRELTYYKHTVKWYKIDPTDFCCVGVKCDKKMVGMISHTKRIYRVRYRCWLADSLPIEIIRAYSDKIRRKDIYKRFEQLLKEEGKYEHIEVLTIEVIDEKYWITPEQMIQIGIDVTEAVEAVR